MSVLTADLFEAVTLSLAAVKATCSAVNEPPRCLSQPLRSKRGGRVETAQNCPMF